MTGKPNLSELLGLSGFDRQSRAAAAMRRWSNSVSDVVRSLDLDEDDPRLAALTDESNGMVEAFKGLLAEQTAEADRYVMKLERPRSRTQRSQQRTASIKGGGSWTGTFVRCEYLLCAEWH